MALVAASDGGVEDVSVALVAASDGGFATCEAPKFEKLQLFDSVEDGVALEAISPLVSLLAGDKFTRFSLTLSFGVGWQVLLASAFGGGDLCTTVFCAPVLDVGGGVLCTTVSEGLHCEYYCTVRFALALFR